jgi:hypothetical protein
MLSQFAPRSRAIFSRPRTLHQHTKMRLDYFKRDAEADHFVTFVIVTRGEFEDGEWKGHDEWSFDGAGRVRIDCAGQSKDVAERETLGCSVAS